MTLVTHYDLELHQMDVKTTLLNGDIEEIIYMVQLENFESKESTSGIQIKKIHIWFKESISSTILKV